MFTGFAPIFPWSFLFFSGFLLGEWFIYALNSKTSQRLLFMAFSGFIIFMPVCVFLLLIYKPYQLTHVTRFNLTTAMVYLTTLILLIAVLGYLLDHRRLNMRGANILAGFGRRALSLYYLQLLALVVPAMVLGASFGFSLHINSILFLPVLLIILLVAHTAINVYWSKVNHKYSLEWFLGYLVKFKFIKQYAET